MLPRKLSIKAKQLTPYDEGSMRELLHLSLPLIISLMSSGLMLFLDRLFLAHYSLEALNAAAHAGASVQFLQFWSMATVCIAEIFVGRYNGAGKLEKMGAPVWQMIWLSLATCLLYVPIGCLAGPYLFSSDSAQDLEIPFFAILTCFLPFSALAAAISSFYIGRGRLIFITFVMLGGNALNILLDWILIFGVSPWIPSYGMKGAAYGTAIAQVLQVLILFTAFLSAKNRALFGTGKWRGNKRLFLSCVRMGAPTAVAHSLEILAWVLIFDLMSRLGSDYMTTVAIAQSVLFLFGFVSEGISKGATAIASNFMGSNKSDLVWKLLASGTKFYFMLFILLTPLLLVSPDPVIAWFIPEEAVITLQLKNTLKTACFWVWIYFFFDGVAWLLVGLLTAAGDTRFVMKVGGVAPILFAFLPVYCFVFQLGAPPYITWMVIASYACSLSTLYFFRFKSERWREAFCL